MIRACFLSRSSWSILSCLGVDAREAVKALIVANHFLETELEKLQAAISTGYARGEIAAA
jgi:hypothetical protein